MKKLIFVFLLSLTMGHVYSQNIGERYTIDWSDVSSLTLVYPQIGVGQGTLQIPASGTVLKFRFYKQINGQDHQAELTNYFIQAFAHIPCLSIETITYDTTAGQPCFIELYLSENTASTTRRITIGSANTHIIIDQSPR